MFPVSLLKLASIAPIMPVCGNLLPLASTSSIFCACFLLFRVGHEFEVAGLGHVEINPHHALSDKLVRTSPSLIRLPCRCSRRSTMPSKGALTIGKVQFGLG